MPRGYIRGMNEQAPDARRNIEIKARLNDLSVAVSVAESLDAERQPDERQIDTYFGCQSGRLKLREINNETAVLIAYQRPDERTAKGSDYILCPVADASLLKQSLTAACRVLAIVRKHRRIFLYRHVRIHLDHVEGLGDFLEFEAVLGPGVEEASSRELLVELQRVFSIDASDLLANSYGELILAAQLP